MSKYFGMSQWKTLPNLLCSAILVTYSLALFLFSGGIPCPASVQCAHFKHPAHTELASAMFIEKTHAKYMSFVEGSFRMLLSLQEIAELRTTISSLREENCQQQLVAEQQLQEVAQKLEDEKQQLMTDNDKAIKVIWGFQSLMLLPGRG